MFCVNLCFLCDYVMCNGRILYLSDDLCFSYVFVKYCAAGWYKSQLKKETTYLRWLLALAIVNRHVLFTMARGPPS
jgi:hypothetical protein